MHHYSKGRGGKITPSPTVLSFHGLGYLYIQNATLPLLAHKLRLSVPVTHH